MAIMTLLNIVNIGMIDNIRTLKPRMSVMPLAKSADAGMTHHLGDPRR